MQPSPHRTVSRLCWVIIAGLWVNAIWWTKLMIERCQHAATYHGYRYRHGAPAEWTFPTDDVVHWAGAIAIEALVLSVLLRLGRRAPGLVAISTGLLCGMTAFVLLPLGMHGTVTFGLHGVALLFAGGWLILMGVASGVVSLVVRDRAAAALLPPGLPVARVVEHRR